jgi:putative ABC transport system permease protein
MSGSRLPISPLMRKSLADVTRRKGRALLVILGILIGVSGLTAINVSGGDLGAAFQFSADETARSNIAITVTDIDPSLAPELAAVANVKTVQIWSFFQSRWKIDAPPGHVNMGIYGSDDLAHLAVNPIQITSGRLPGPGEVLMESSDRGLQSFAVGDTISIDSTTGPETLTVVGLARTVGTSSAAFNDHAIGYMSAEGLGAISGRQEPNLIDVLLDDSGKSEQTATELVSVLRAHHVDVLNVGVRANDFDPGPINGVFTIMRVLSLIALLLTAFLIVNTATTLVAEQIGIVGTMRAIGATRGTVIRSYLFTVFIYAVLGTVLGLALGIYLGYLLTAFFVSIITLDLGPFALDPGVILVSILVGLAIPLLAALLPLRTGTRISVRDALAAYGVSAGERSSRGWLARRITWLPQTTLLGMRGVFRRRGRAFLTLLALSLAAIAFLAIQTTTYSFSQFLGQIFSQYNFDVTLGVSKPLPAPAIEQQILATPNVARVERFEQVQLPTTWGTMVMEATEPNPQVYHFDLRQGRLYTGDDQNVMLLSQVAAQKTGLGIGDTMTFTLPTGTATWRIIGIVHDLNGGLGTIGTGLTTISTLNALRGLPADEGGGYFIQARDRSPAAVNALAERLDATFSAQGLAPSISTAQQQIARNQSQFQILNVLLYSVSVLVALVGALGLFNTLTTSVLERRREIGILRSMGATGAKVAGVFWTEGFTLAILAWVAGIILGIPAAYGFVALLNAVLLPVPFAFDPLSLLVMLVFTLIVAALASVLPALRASRVRVVETLRYE